MVLNGGRLRVLLSAYACEPGRGSEPEVGLQAMLAAASEHEVWVLTRSNNLPAVEAFLAMHPFGDRIHLIGLDLAVWLQRAKKILGGVGIHLYYDMWQRRAAIAARQLDEVVGFDLVHHVTFATHWTRAGVAVLEKPFLLGPVGGGVETPLRLLAVLGFKGLIRDGFRWLVKTISERLPSHRRMVERATLILAQNPETADRLSGARLIKVAPNGVSATPDPVLVAEVRRPELVVVGRLVPYKAGVLAVDTLASVSHPYARLVFVGDGPDRVRIERRARKLGVRDRVEFTGPISRAAVFRRVAEASALLHPALHDDSPLTVAESMALGTPVVCLERGGPPVVCREFPTGRYTAVSPFGSRKDVTARLAHAATAYLAEVREPARDLTRPRVTFGAMLLESYDKLEEEGRSSLQPET